MHEIKKLTHSKYSQKAQGHFQCHHAVDKVAW